MSQQITVYPGGRAADSAVGPSETIIARNIASNFPEYNGQPVQESLVKWQAIVQGTTVTVRNRIWNYPPWRGYEKFHPEKKDRIISMVIERIQRNHALGERGISLRPPERWVFKRTGQVRQVEVIRDEKGRFVGGFPPVFVGTMVQPEFFYG